MKPTFLHITAALFAAASSCLAASPLAGLPSQPPGAHLEKIKALAEGEWLHLGAPAADPKWGRARGRSWACRMPFAPELRGAFLFGEGVHGFVKPDGQIMDDLWFYDLNGHRWICCYPGSEVATLELKVNADGFEANPTGEPIPIALMTHAYEGLTYDPDARRMMFMPCSNTDYLQKDVKARRALWLEGQTVNKSEASPWFWESKTGKWNRLKTTSPSPRSGFGDSFHYLPGQKRAWFRHGEGIWSYDTAANTWTQLKPTGPKLPFGIDATSCHDPKRARIYIGGGAYPVTPAGTNAFRIYDLKTDTWLDPQPQGAPCHGSNSYATNSSAMIYDPANDRVLLFRYAGKKEERGIFIYDPEANAWSEASARIPAEWGDKNANAFHDPVLGVYFFNVGGDSSDNATVWVYRHKPVKR